MSADRRTTPVEAQAGHTIANALAIVMREGWSHRHRDEVWAREVFEAWLRHAADDDDGMVRLIDDLDARLLPVYGDEMRYAVVCLLLLKLYAQARQDGRVQRRQPS